MRRCRFILVVFFFALSLPGGGIRANDAWAVDDTQTLRQAISHYARGDFDETLALLRRVVAQPGARNRVAQAYLYVGLTYAAQDKPSESVAAFSWALTYVPTIQLDPARFKPSHIELLRKAQAQGRGEVKVSADVADAVVQVDGRQLGTTPLSIWLPLGKHQISVLDAKGAGQVFPIDVKANKAERVSAKFAVEPPPTVIPPKEQTPASIPVPVPAKLSSAPVASPPKLSSENATSVIPPSGANSSEKVTKRLWTWVTLGLAVAVGATAIGLKVSADNRHNTWETLNGGMPDLTGADLAQWEEMNANIQGIQSTNDAMLRSSLALTVTAGALAITSVVLFFIEGRPSPAKETASKPSISIAPQLGEAKGFAVTGRF
jgi:hypothetical protein